MTRILRLIVLAAVAAGACGQPGPPSSGTGLEPLPSAVVGGRTVCPGSVPRAETGLTGAPADAVESIQGEFGEQPGFLAVVFDGSQAVIVVASTHLLEWQARLEARGLAVAPSCVDPALLAAIEAALPQMRPAGESHAAGYNGIDDAVEVRGVTREEVVRAVEAIAPGMRDALLAAISAGTLRIDGRPLPAMR